MECSNDYVYVACVSGVKWGIGRWWVRGEKVLKCPFSDEENFYSSLLVEVLISTIIKSGSVLFFSFSFLCLIRGTWCMYCDS
jgi:hypothetical protein